MNITWKQARTFCKNEQMKLLQVFSHENWKYIDDITEGYLNKFDSVPIGLTCKLVIGQ